VRKQIRLYANIIRHIRDRTPEGFAVEARKAVDDGFTALKIAPFDELKDPDHIRTGPKAAWRIGAERIRSVRAAIGDDIELAVDCHRRKEVSEAIMMAEFVAAFNLIWLEEPVSKDMPESLLSVYSRAPMPIAFGERYFGVEGFRGRHPDGGLDRISGIKSTNAAFI